ncbi:hypothetical protein SAMN06265220_11130 [Flavobacterium nitrogenifigens]|uniref:Uncharacterized protein n=1 Tax=Flavobacterium nitrogenifigens TaxID=1617283 RepID=A0A521FFD4_9FLAO|nr:hypothetical protein SAMN06265220_11130 [Flavobacterium nitrogenifigens]
MTIKEINVEKRVQTSLRKRKGLNYTVFFNAVSEPNQYYESNAFNAIESKNWLHLKTTQKTAHIMTKCIGLPRPFY